MARAARNNGPLIVGIGASAGGVEALQSFFRAMPADSGLAFIVVLHLGERYESALPDILARCTPMSVLPARNGDTIDPGHVYVLGADAVLTVSRRKLRLGRHLDLLRERHTIDVFLASLAEDVGENAIAVILSGLGNDGTLGAKAIKEKGGLTIAQAPDHGKPSHPEMPESAIASGAIDLELPVEQMGAKLVEYADGHGRLETDGQPRARRDQIDGARRRVCQILLDELGHDFAGYKERTMLRRIERRMQVLELKTIEDYVACLRRDRGEMLALFRDLLIGVTAFFRDKEAFDVLAERVVPQLFEGKGAGDSVRVWVPGCATGEEVYSIAILLLDYMAKVKRRIDVQCFATDIDEAGIAVARSARYPAAMVRNLPPELVDRYFTTDANGTYTLSREVRELCIFSTHSVIRDPPFSRIDLISCRNLLIYLDSNLQSQLVPVFHYALRRGGYLFLGTSENLTRHSEYFSPVDQKQRIFRRDDAVSAGNFPLVLPGARGPRPTPRHYAQNLDGVALRQLVERRVMEHFTPAHVVVNSDGDVVYYSARTGNYLEQASGAPTRQLVSMARRGLRLELRGALNQAIETRRPALREGIRVETDHDEQLVDLTVEPLPERDGHPLFLVIFADVRSPRAPEGEIPGIAVPAGLDVEHLETELRDTRERLQSMVEEYETAIEELKSANEELLSTNEELQTTNEELETSREESQSINEELNTVNSELQSKLEQLDQANDDLRNLFESTPTGTVFLDENLVIRTFTPAIGSIFNLIASDRGRPLTDIASDLEGVDLRQEIEAVLRSRQGRERRVARRGGGATYLMRILPDNTAKNDGGALISFIDISRIVEVERHQRSWNEGAEALLTMVLRIAGESVPSQPAVSTPKAEALMNRLRSLGGTYNLLTRVEWGEVSMRDLVGEELGHLAGGAGSRVAIDGPEVMLKPKAAIALGMALHELAANAVRHGALSAPGGSIRVSWGIEQAGTPQARFVLKWRESGGLSKAERGRQGFGCRLIEEELAIDLDAAGRIDFAEDGVSASVAVPLSTELVVLPQGAATIERR